MKCSICEKEIPAKDGGWSSGNNAQPVNNGRCCDQCDTYVVIPARLREFAARTAASGDEEPEYWLYLLSHNGCCRIVGEDDNWTTAHQLTGETGRLFAAAPSLLAALKALVQRAESQLWSDHWLADARRVIDIAEGRKE